MPRKGEYICHRWWMYVVEDDLLAVEVNMCHESQVCIIGEDYVCRRRQCVCRGGEYVS